MKPNLDFFKNLNTRNYKMVFLVRMDLKMGVGKIAAQVGHAVLGAYQNMEEQFETDSKAEELMSKWEESGQPKIVLKVDSSDQMLDLHKKCVNAGINTYIVQDAGRT
jgi:PTH2 family peptidyl-tRNA hydrolase